MKLAGRYICVSVVFLLGVFLLTLPAPAEPDKEFQPVLKDYRIHINDVLDISVWGVEGLMKTVTVRPDGKISFPLIGDIYAIGKSPEELSIEMEKKLGEFVKESDVSIVLLTFRKPVVYILGEIKSPGSFSLTGPYTMLQLLAEARLIRPDMNENHVKVIRDGIATDVSLDITGEHGEVNASNFRLEEEDVVYITHKGVASVRVVGASSGRTSKYPLPNDPSDIADVLAEAGELSEQTFAHGVKLMRGSQVMQLSLSNLPEDFELRHNDVIFVPAVKKETFTISGYVSTPGVYPFTAGFTVLDAIQSAGGFKSDGSMENVEIRRDYPNGQEILIAGNLYDPQTRPPELMPGDLIYINKRKSSVGKFFLEKVVPAVRDVSIISSLMDN